MRFLLTFVFIPFSLSSQTFQAYSAALADLNLLGPQALIIANPANKAHYKQRLALHSCIWPGLKDLNEASLSFGRSAQGKHYGILLQQWGPLNYREQMLAMAFGLELSSKMALGIRMDLLQKQIVEKDKSFHLNSQLYWDYHPSANWQWANRLQIDRKPVGAKLSLDSQMSFQGLSGLRLLMGISLPQQSPGFGAFALEYNFKDWLFLRQGFKLKQNLDYRAGLGIRWKAWILDLGFQWQKALGAGQQLSLSYCWL